MSVDEGMDILTYTLPVSSFLYLGLPLLLVNCRKLCFQPPHRSVNTLKQLIVINWMIP